MILGSFCAIRGPTGIHCLLWKQAHDILSKTFLPLHEYADKMRSITGACRENPSGNTTRSLPGYWHSVRFRTFSLLTGHSLHQLLEKTTMFYNYLRTRLDGPSCAVPT